MRSVRLAVALVAALVGCEQNPFCPDEPPRPTPPPASTPSSNGGPPASMNLDSGLALEHADPPPLAGDLRAEIDGFHSLEQCVAQHAAIDPLVGDAVIPPDKISALELIVTVGFPPPVVLMFKVPRTPVPL